MSAQFEIAPKDDLRLLELDTISKKLRPCYFGVVIGEMNIPQSDMMHVVGQKTFYFSDVKPVNKDPLVSREFSDLVETNDTL